MRRDTIRASCEGRPVAGLAVEDDAGVLVLDRVLDPGLEVPARNVYRTGKPSLVVFMLLPDVDDKGVVPVVHDVVDIARVDLLDLFLYLSEKLCT